MKSSRFAVAVHILVSVEYSARNGEVYLPSSALAKSVNTNAVFVRELLRKLGKVNLVVTKEGKGGGVQLARPASAINLRQVYEAVESTPLLTTNPRPQHKPCPVSCGMQDALCPVFNEVEASMLRILERRKISDLVNGISK
jgi:Rrf2 family protein